MKIDLKEMYFKFLSFVMKTKSQEKQGLNQMAHHVSISPWDTFVPSFESFQSLLNRKTY